MIEFPWFGLNFIVILRWLFSSVGAGAYLPVFRQVQQSTWLSCTWSCSVNVQRINGLITTNKKRMRWDCYSTSFWISRLLLDQFLDFSISRCHCAFECISTFFCPSNASIEYTIVELVMRGFRYLGSSGFPLQHFG